MTEMCRHIPEAVQSGADADARARERDDAPEGRFTPVSAGGRRGWDHRRIGMGCAPAQHPGVMRPTRLIRPSGATLWATRRWTATASTLACIALASVAAAVPVVALAADPTPAPTPLVFNTPQYLVWMESHSSANGVVEDRTYWLYIVPPDENGYFAVPDGGGGMWHYAGRLIGGPFAGDADACPAMLGVGVMTLQAWVVYAGEEAQVVDCTRFLATGPPTMSSAAPGATTWAGETAAPGSGSTDLGNDGDIDAELLGLAVALIGLLLFGGGFLLNRASRGAPTPEVVGSGIPADVDTSQRPDPMEPSEPLPDPCSAQADALTHASEMGRYLNDLLASCRRYEALLQEQIDTLAYLVLPGSAMLDIGMAAGGLSGGISRRLIGGETFAWALGEAVTKDLLKELAKQGLGSAGGGLDGDNLAAEGSKSAIKAAILQAVEASFINGRYPFPDPAHPTPPTRVFRNPAEYDKFLKEIRGYARDVATPVKDAMGSVIDLYQGVTSAVDLKDRLDNLRAQRDRIADERVDIEMRFEDVLGEQRFAAERLAKCRELNSPDWRP